jgi:hypothetical protein
METLIMGPFISQIISCICFQLCLKGVTTSQKLAQDHQCKFLNFHLIFICCNITEIVEMDLGIPPVEVWNFVS